VKKKAHFLSCNAVLARHQNNECRTGTSPSMGRSIHQIGFSSIAISLHSRRRLVYSGCEYFSDLL